MGTALTITRSWARIHSTDRCPRCSGLMVVEWRKDLSDYTAQRCVHCGEIVDLVILHNRQLQHDSGDGRRGEVMRSDQKIMTETGRTTSSLRQGGAASTRRSR